MTDLPPVIMTPEEIAEAEEQSLEVLHDWLDRQEQKKREHKPSQTSTCTQLAMSHMPVVQPTDELLTPEQLADRLHVSVNWVREQIRERTRVRTNDPLPYLKTGKYVRFNWREVWEWQTRHEVKGEHNAPSKRQHQEGQGTRRVVRHLA